MGYYVNFAPSVIPDHGTPEYAQWRTRVDGQLIKQLQPYCKASFDYEGDLGAALQKLNSGANTLTTDELAEDIFNEVARRVWCGELIIVRDLIDQIPEHWLVTQYEIERGILTASFHSAESLRRRNGAGPTSPYTNNPPPPPIPKPIPNVAIQGWIQIDIIDYETAQPIPNVALDIEVPQGSKSKSGKFKTSNSGQINVLNLAVGSCKIAGQKNKFVRAKTLAVVGTGRASADTKIVDKDNRKIIYTNGPYTLAKITEYQVQAGDTFASIAQTNNSTEKDIARFNWQTTNTKKIQKHLIEDLGGTQPETEGDKIVFEETGLLGQLLIPQPWAIKSMQTMSTAQIKIKPAALSQNGKTLFSIKLVDAVGTIYSNVAYELEVDGKKIKGTTDNDGVIEKYIPPPVGESILTIWPDSNDPDYAVIMETTVKVLEPEETVAGQQARLTNQSFACGTVDGIMGSKTRNAIEKMETDCQLDPSAPIGDKIREMVKRAELSKA